MSRLERLAAEILNTGRLPDATFERGRPDPIAFWREGELGMVAFLSHRSDGAFDVLSVGGEPGPGGEWADFGAVIGSGVSYEFPERPETGIDVFAMHGTSGISGFPGFAAPGVEEVVAEGLSFPVFEPLGAFLAVLRGERDVLAADGFSVRP